MMAIARVQTIRGLAPSPDEISDDDILEVDGAMTDSAPPPSLRMTVPPPSGTRFITTGRYSQVVLRRRRTLRLIGDEA